jgi:hypothetical protein
LPEINPGDSVTGSISNQVFFNPYVLRATAGEEIVITMEAVEDLDPLVILLADNQEPLAENDDVDDGNQDSRLEFTIPETGSYVIVASRFEQEAGTTTGAYTLTVTRAGEEVSTEEGGTEGSLVQRLNPARISPGGTPAGAFAPLRFANVYAFGVTDAALVDFSVSTDSTIASTIILADGLLQPIAVTDGGTLLGVQLPASGNYVFIVAPASGPAQGITEDYILAFNATGADVILAQEPNGDATDTPEAPEAPPIVPISYSETVEGVIDDDTPQREYVFTGLAGDVIRINMRGAASGLDTLVQLLDEDGNVVGENDDMVAGENRDSLLQVALPENGEYTIIATRFSPGDGAPASAGEFELTLAFVDPETVGISPVVEPIEAGETVSNAVSDDQYLMFYTFNGNSGDVVDITVNTLSGDLDAVLYVYAYTSSGEPVEIRRNDESPRGGTFDPLIEDLVLPRTGPYLIAVGRFPQSTSTGEFSLSLQVTPAGAVPSAPLETPTPLVEG